MISIHALQAESDLSVDVATCVPVYFNPRSPSGERPSAHSLMVIFLDFNPRSPSGERLYIIQIYHVAFLFQSTLSKRRATGRTERFTNSTRISIHALQAESDYYDSRLTLYSDDFNPRSPSGERLLEIWFHVCV